MAIYKSYCLFSINGIVKTYMNIVRYPLSKFELSLLKFISQAPNCFTLWQNTAPETCINIKNSLTGIYIPAKKTIFGIHHWRNFFNLFVFALVELQKVHSWEENQIQCHFSKRSVEISLKAIWNSSISNNLSHLFMYLFFWRLKFALGSQQISCNSWSIKKISHISKFHFIVNRESRVVDL